MSNIEVMSNDQRISGLKEILSVLPNIGVDIDGTLADTIGATLLEIKKRFGDVMDFSDWKKWNPHEIPELQASGIRTITDTIELFYGILQKNGNQIVYPINGSVEGVVELGKFSKELIAVSGRLESSRAYTTEWLMENYSNVFKKICLTDHDTSRQIPKHTIARLYNIGLMIEDNAHYAIDLAEHGIPTILLEAPWNIDVDSSGYPEIYRFKNWHDLTQLLHK